MTIDPGRRRLTIPNEVVRGARVVRREGEREAKAIFEKVKKNPWGVRRVKW